MAAKLQCEICGGKLIGKPGGIFECDSCGMEYSTAWAKEKIQEITGTVKVEGTVEVTGKVQVEGPIQVDSAINKEVLLQRGNLALEDREWEKAKNLFDKVLNLDAHCAEAYLGLAMAEAEKRAQDTYAEAYCMANSPLRIFVSKNVIRARQFDKNVDNWFANMDMQGKRADEKARQTLPKVRSLIAPVSKIIATGNRQTVGLKADGTVLATKYMGILKSDASKWHNITAIATDTHTVGLMADGTLVASGNNTYGQCEVSQWNDIVAVAAEGNHTVALKTDGTVVAVGCNEDGQCDVKEWSNIVAVAAGGRYTLGLKADGTVVAAGWNEYGQCDISAWRDIIAIAAGGAHTLGLKADGTVISAGDNTSGQCNVSAWHDIVAIAAGGMRSAGLKADGTVVSIGWKECSQAVSKWTNIVALAVESRCIVGLKADGTVVADGDNSFGECDVSGWKLFGSLETLEDERKAAAEKAEAKRKAAAEKAEAERKAKIEDLRKEQATFQTELSNLHGLFTGKRRREIEERLAEIEAELKRSQ